MATAYALRLGRAQWGKRVFGSMEANWLLIAPPRKHKSGMLADWILDWPGAAIATSTRADLFALTAGTRWRHGPVFVFNPYQVGEVPSSFGWDVVSGCEDPAEAFIRADAIIGPRTATGDMAWWQDKAAIALAALLHAAALSGRTVLDIWDWANREGDAIAGSALAGHPAASRQLRSRVRGGHPGGPVPGLHPHDHGQVPDLGRGPGRGRHGPRPRRPAVRRGRVRRVLRHAVHDRARRRRGHDRAAVPVLHRLRAAHGQPVRLPPARRETGPAAAARPG